MASRMAITDIRRSAWIPPHLPRETQLQLRHEISKPVSDEDIPGYIYVHEMGSQGAWTRSASNVAEFLLDGRLER